MRVRAVIELEIDSAAYDALGIEAEYFVRLLAAANEHCALEDHLPYWARDVMRVTGRTVEVVQ